jgi:DNA (cytosine-5)-methyltransferase 1
MEQAGIKIVGFVEKDKKAIETHHKNFPDCQLIGADITQITDEIFSQYKGTINIIFGGFPCQSFSHAGKKDPNDIRGQLFYHLIRAGHLIQPDIIIGENVKGILKRSTPNGLNVSKVIISELNNIGYTIQNPITLNSQNFGIPQSRERVFFIATKNKMISSDFIFNNLCQLTIPPITIRDILVDSAEDSLLIDRQDIMNMIPIGKFYKISDNCSNEGTPPKNLIKCYNFIDTSGLSYSVRNKPSYGCIVDIDNISRTIQCTYNRMPRLFVPIQKGLYGYIRPYTIIELQQIQGFPKTFSFVGNKNDQINQIGNAVPPPMVKYICSLLLNYIK